MTASTGVSTEASADDEVPASGAQAESEEPPKSGKGDTKASREDAAVGGTMTAKVELDDEDTDASKPISKNDKKSGSDGGPAVKSKEEGVSHGSKIEDGKVCNIEDDDDDDDVLVQEAQPSKPRREVDGNKAKFRTDAVHVYGLDFLTQEHMKEIFNQFNHKYVEWIDDTCANVVFRDAKGAQKALESLSFPKVGDEPWRRTPDILVAEDLPPVFLQLRFAVSTDVKPKKFSLPQAPAFFTPSFQRDDGKEGGLYADRSRGRMSQVYDFSNRRRPAPVTEEEKKKRQKRGERFGENARDAIEGKIASSEEELAKRRKRAERFGNKSGKRSESPSKGDAEAQRDEPNGKVDDKDAGTSAPGSRASVVKEDI